MAPLPAGRKVHTSFPGRTTWLPATARASPTSTPPLVLPPRGAATAPSTVQAKTIVVSTTTSVARATRLRGCGGPPWEEESAGRNGTGAVVTASLRAPPPTAASTGRD